MILVTREEQLGPPESKIEATNNHTYALKKGSQMGPKRALIWDFLIKYGINGSGRVLEVSRDGLGFISTKFQPKWTIQDRKPNLDQGRGSA